MKRAKLIGTLGPSSSEVKTITELIKAGLDVARVNMSHGTHEQHAQLIRNIRQASKKAKKEVGILIDLQGPKIRVDKLTKPLILNPDEEWVIGPSSKRDQYKNYENYIPTIYEKLVDDCHDGARILFDDGNLAAEAIARDGDVYQIKVTTGGLLKSNKGINLPDCVVSAPAFTEKDREDLLFGLKQDCDFIALSFVRRKEDIQEVKYLLHSLKKNTPIIAKIEKPQALDNIDEIIAVTDLIMVARGDMGVELGNHLVPAAQKELIQKCNDHRIPVITATQMLESMTGSPTPTRAEATDVANAIWDGTDAVMLSGETAAGQYPVEAVSMMVKIIEEAEKKPKERPYLRNIDLSNVQAAVMVAASMVAEKVQAKKIISVTESGQSCKNVSHFRSQIPVLGVTNRLEVARKLSLYWGVVPYFLEDFNEETFDFQQDVIDRVIKDLGLTNGDKLVITRGDGRFFTRGSSNSVKVEIVRDRPNVPGGTDSLLEGSDDKKKILLDTSICSSCHACIAICPHDIWQINTEQNNNTMINGDKVSACTMDEECIRVCPTGAIEIIPLS